MDQRVFYRQRQAHFSTSSRQQVTNKEQIHQRFRSLNLFLASIGLELDNVNIKEKPPNQFNHDYQINIYKHRVQTNLKERIYKMLKAKDQISLSNRKLKIMMETLNEDDKTITLHNITKLQKEMNKKFTIEKIFYENTMNIRGLYFRIEQKIHYIVSKYIESCYAMNPNYVVKNEIIKLKFSADGTNLTSSGLNIINFTFSIINDIEVKTGCKSAQGHYILGMYQVEKECYDEVKISLEKAFDEIKKLDQLTIMGKTYTIIKYLCCDMKMLLIIYGLLSANSNHPCVFCHYKKGDTNDVWDKRNLQEARNPINHQTSRFGYVRPPIQDAIDFDKCVIDRLHLFMRITEKIFQGFLFRIIEADSQFPIYPDIKDYLIHRKNLKIFFDFLKTNSKVANPIYVTKLKKIELRGNISGGEWTRVYEAFILQDHSSRGYTIDNDTLAIFNKVTREFYECYKSTNQEITDIPSFKLRLKDWLNEYRKTGQSETPYIHGFVYHIPEMMEQFKNMSWFETQGLEKLNDFSTQDYHNQTNKRFNSFLEQLLNKFNRLDLHKFNYDLKCS